MRKLKTVQVFMAALLCASWALVHAAIAFEAKDFPYKGMRVIHSKLGYTELADRLDKAVAANGLAIVERASASAGAERRGIKIPGNMVVGVFRNDFAVHMLGASIPAGIEAPLRFYVTEASDHSTTLSYREPSSVFAPYGDSKLTAMAGELDTLFERIAKAATSTK